MNPLIITATPNICWLNPEIPYPQTLDDIVAESQRCQAAGAAILHIHAPKSQWRETIEALRSSTGLIVQCGMSSLPIPERADVFKHRADMISIIMSHHDEAFVGLDVHVLHPREELAEYAQLSRRHGTRLEMEIWHTGSIWNLNYMIEHGLLDPPYITTLFFGWPGGTWSPPTIEEYLHRRTAMPAHCAVTVSIMGIEQIDILTAAILSGDHVRVGTEDYPYSRDGQVAETHKLVQEIADVARSVGRPIATVDQARQLTGT